MCCPILDMTQATGFFSPDEISFEQIRRFEQLTANGSREH
jgi:hypothetical protein